MSASDSVASWILRLKAGDPVAAERLWERYFCQMVGLARRQLRPGLRRAADEEDVALSAFNSFCRGLERGRFPRLDDRDNLWRLLAVLTARKAGHLVRRETAQKRGGPAAARADADVALLIGREPTPEDAALMAEECRRRLDQLGDDTLRAVALARMEGLTTEEIAARLGCVARTVERKLELIRVLWLKEDVS